MLRRSICGPGLAALAALLFAGAGCQSYNFNPVGQCIIQPGSSRFQLAGTTVADILFVVDDSGSMQAEQARLASNFDAFIKVLADEQKLRAQRGQEPFEFHVAITTSSVFESWKAALPEPVCSGATPTCRIPSSRWSLAVNEVACSSEAVGATCSDHIRTYFPETSSEWSTCGSHGVGTAGSAFPAGDFVAVPGNPRVLHFGKELGWASWGTPSQDPALTALAQQFRQNVNVGTCGSGMEQPLEAGRLAVKKALQQDGLAQPGGVAAAEWPHPGSKLVVVWVGDEDDCSNPDDPTRSLAFSSATSVPGEDVCVTDEKKPSGRTLFPVEDYAAFFSGLGRQVSAAFVYSADPSRPARPDANGNVVCTPGTCDCQCPATCSPGGCGTNPSQFSGDCLIPSDCSGKVPFITRTDGTPVGSRLAQLSSALRASGTNTFEASVCEANWSNTLTNIAQLAKPPPGLTLPTQPATSDVTVLRIESADGKTARYCSGPGTAADWNFIDCRTGAPSGPEGKTASLCLVINHGTGNCEASAGETYIAQYLGRVPAGGCKAASDCTTALGGKDTDWQCLITGTDTTGTCLCSQ